MTTWADEYLTLLDDCEAREERLTDWERGFVDSLRRQIEQGRLSVLRTTLDPKAGRWVDGITWDELQSIKAECGYSRHDALELYPPDSDVVNVANLRHLWVMRELQSFAWRKGAA